MMHEQVRSRLSPYLEGELPPREEEALEAHLAECPPCSAEFRALRRAVDLLHDLPTPELPSDIGGAVLERLRAGEGARRTSGTPWVRLAPFALAAGIVAVALLTPVEEAEAPKLTFDASPPTVIMARAPVQAAAGRAEIGLQNGDSAAPRMQVSPFPVCLARFRTGRGAGPDCAAWDAYLVQLANDDAPRFSLEVRGLPKRHQQALMDRISQFAAVTGSAPTLGTTLRRSRDPQMLQFATRVERRSNAPLRYVAYEGR